jgi:hypothetical protein
MSDEPADVDLDLDQPARQAPPTPAGRDRRPLLAIGAVAVLLLALGGAYLYLRAPWRQPDAAPARTEAGAPRDRAAAKVEEIQLPPLDASDPLVRELIGRLSSHPTVAAWMTTDGLILNFTVVTLRISNGETPAQELRAVGPVPPFHPQSSREDLFVDPSSYRRYDRYAEAVSSIDSRGAARLYTTLKPRIGEAYQRMGSPTGDFDAVLERAFVELLRVPIVNGRVELAPHGIGYAYVDSRLEGLSAAQKHLLRMGPRNVQTIQSKLREIADYLAIPSARLPPTRTIP